MASPQLPINLLVEGVTDEAVLRRILAHVHLPCGTVYGKQGKQALLKRLPNYNQAARFAPWLVVVDLDQDAECAPEFIQTHLPELAERMVFRVAVRAIEAWLLADAEHIAGFLSVSPQKIPRDPDSEADPKKTLINIARDSRKKVIREEIPPREGSGGQVGLGYAGRLIEFVIGNGKFAWRPEAAMKHSDSLRRCMEALKVF